MPRLLLDRACRSTSVPKPKRPSKIERLRSSAADRNLSRLDAALSGRNVSTCCRQNQDSSVLRTQIDLACYALSRRPACTSAPEQSSRSQSFSGVFLSLCGDKVFLRLRGRTPSFFTSRGPLLSVPRGNGIRVAAMREASWCSRYDNVMRGCRAWGVSSSK